MPAPAVLPRAAAYDEVPGLDAWSALPWLGVAVALLAAFGLAWSGVWRGWVGSGVHENVPLLVAPMGGSLLLTFWLGVAVGGPAGTVIGVVGMGVSLVFFGFLFHEPRWYGPRWYREIKDQRRAAARARRDARRAARRARRAARARARAG